jgi:hypothetical protein
MCYHTALSEEVFERPEFFVASLEMLKEYLVYLDKAEAMLDAYLDQQHARCRTPEHQAGGEP